MIGNGKKKNYKRKCDNLCPGTRSYSSKLAPCSNSVGQSIKDKKKERAISGASGIRTLYLDSHKLRGELLKQRAE